MGEMMKHFEYLLMAIVIAWVTAVVVLIYVVAQ